MHSPFEMATNGIGKKGFIALRLYQKIGYAQRDIQSTVRHAP
jgi:hypothetical protein